MEKPSFEQITDYGAALAIATQLLRHELITTNEYHLLTAKLKQQYGLVVSSFGGRRLPSPKTESRKEVLR